MKDYQELLQAWHAREYSRAQLEDFASSMQDLAQDAFNQASYFQAETNLPLAIKDWQDKDADRIIREHLERALDYATLARMARKLSYIQSLDKAEA